MDMKTCLKTNKLMVTNDSSSAWVHSDTTLEETYPMQIVDCDSKGLGAVSNRAFLPGDVIAQTHTQNATCVPLSKYRNSFCMNCHSPIGADAEAGAKATQCGPLSFCSKDCADLGRSLVDDCADILDFLYNFKSTEPSFAGYAGFLDSLALVVVVLARVPLCPAELASLRGLENHQSDGEVDGGGKGDDDEMCFYGEFLAGCIGRLAPRLRCPGPEASALIRAVRFNAQTLSFNYLPRPVLHTNTDSGTGASTSSTSLQVLTVLPLLARINHSCSPNAAIVFIPRPQLGSQSAALGAPASIMLKAVRTVAVGEEICCSYLEMSALCTPAAERRPLLLAGSRFSCECQRCSEELAIAHAHTPSAPSDPFCALDDRQHQELLERCINANDMTAYYSYRVRQCQHFLTQHRGREREGGHRGGDDGDAARAVARAVAADPTVVHLHTEVLEEVAALYMNNHLNNHLATETGGDKQERAGMGDYASTNSAAPALPLPYVIYELAGYYMAYLLSLTTTAPPDRTPNPKHDPLAEHYLCSRRYCIRTASTNRASLLLRLAVLLTCFADMTGCALSPLFNCATANLAETLRAVVLHTLRFVKAYATSTSVSAGAGGQGQQSHQQLSPKDLEFILTRALLLVSKCTDLLSVYNSRGGAGEPVSLHTTQLTKCRLYFETQLRRWAPEPEEDDTGKWTRRSY